jgi:hypothetical protein
MQNEPIEVTFQVTGILEKLDIPYLIGGSLASTLYGMVCTTQDSDVITEMRSEHIQPFIAALQDEFFVDEEMIADAVNRHSSFNIIHRETMFKVDVFIPRSGPFQKSQLAVSKDKPSILNPGSVPILPVQKTPSSPNSNGIEWAVKSQNDNGATFWVC